MSTVNNNHYEAAQFLLERGAHPNAENRHKVKALQIAHAKKSEGVTP